MREICEIWMKTNVLNMLLSVSDVVLLIFITSEVHSLEQHSQTSMMELFCKSTVSICVIYFTHVVFDFIFITSNVYYLEQPHQTCIYDGAFLQK